MKKIGTVLLAAILTPAGFAASPASVVLNSSSVRLSQASSDIVRTARTPALVVLSVPVAMSHSYCANYDTIEEYGQDSSCGYRTIERVRCDYDGDGYFDDAPRDGWNNGSGNTIDFGHSNDGWNNDFDDSVLDDELHDDYLDDDCRITRTSEMRSCYHTRTVCTNTEISTSTQMRKIKVRFRKASVLSGKQKEVFHIDVAQRRLDAAAIRAVGTTVSAKKTYKAKFRPVQDKLVFRGRN